jgi:hypothetical protein
MVSTPRGPSRRAASVTETVVGLTVGALIVMLVGFLPFPPLQDFPEWIYQSHVIGELLRGRPSPYFYLHPYPVPYCASQLIMAALDVVLGTAVGPKVFVAAYLALGYLLSVKLSRRYELYEPLVLPLLVGFIVCNSTFFSGYANYQIGLLVLIGYLCLDDARQASVPASALFALLAFAAHGFAFVGLAILAGSKAIVQRRVPAFVVSMVPAGLLAAWYLLAQTGAPALAGIVRYGSPRFFAYKLYTLAKAGPYRNFWIGPSGDLQQGARWLYAAGVTVNLAFAALIALGLARLLVSERSDPDLRWVRLAAGALLAGFLFSPDVALGVVNPGERFLYPLLLVWLLQFGTTRPRWVEGVATPVLVTTSTVLLVCVARLIHATASTDPRTLRSERVVPAPAQSRALFEVRPFQFVEDYDTWTDEARRGADTDVVLTFRTSMLGDRRAKR